MNLQLYKAISAAQWKSLPNGRLNYFLHISNLLFFESDDGSQFSIFQVPFFLHQTDKFRDGGADP